MISRSQGWPCCCDCPTAHRTAPLPEKRCRSDWRLRHCRCGLHRRPRRDRVCCWVSRHLHTSVSRQPATVSQRSSIAFHDEPGGARLQRDGVLLALQDCPTGKSPKSLSIPSRKNIPLSPSGKSKLEFVPSRAHKRGASRSSRTLGAGSGGRELRGRRARMTRTAKSCGPDVQ